LALLASLVPDDVTDSALKAYVETLREQCEPFPDLGVPVMDCCGTGGSGLAHYNTSSTVAFVLAAAGVPVVKFGNRGMSSASGSFDFLEAIGVPVQTPPKAVVPWFEQAGLLFLYAPQWYPALKPFNILRKQLGHKTVFNYLGPLLNPAQPAYRLLGVSSQEMAQRLAQFLADDGKTQSAWVVSAQSGLDELAHDCPTRVIPVEKGLCQKAWDLMPRASWLSAPQTPEASGVAANVEIFKALLSGEDTGSAWYRLVCLNAGAGLVVSGQAESLAAGVDQAQALLASGRVQAKWQEVQLIYAAHLG